MEQLLGRQELKIKKFLRKPSRWAGRTEVTSTSQEFFRKPKWMTVEGGTYSYSGPGVSAYDPSTVAHKCLGKWFDMGKLDV